MLTALTGGIGAGKSTVLEIFRELGAETKDTDTEVHKIYEEDNEIHRLLKEKWGSKVFTDDLPDRKKIAGVVFGNKENLEWLNGVMHPRVRQKISKVNKEGLTVIAVPLLFEVNWQSYFDNVISVWCSTSKQIPRLLKRGWTQEEIDRRLSAQMNQDEKLSRANFGIINNWTMQSLTRQCRIIFTKLYN